MQYPKIGDIEKDIKKNFKLQSYSLDYVAKMLGFKGKKKVVMDDWLNVIFKLNRRSYNKLIDYCKQDVELTRAIYNKINNYTVRTKCS
jgi:DNA polymerase elongation subunit (family B)